MSEPTIRFGTDGWRAAIAEDFTFKSVARVAEGVARLILDDSTRRHSVIVGYDRRFGSERFAETIANVMTRFDIAVKLSEGPVPTQLCSFLAKQEDCMALVVTASHNPWYDNGVKVKDSSGSPATEEVLRRIESHIPEDVDEVLLGVRPGVEKLDITESYAAAIRSQVDTGLICSTSARVLVDPIHGCGSGWLERLVDPDSALRIDTIRGSRDPYFGGVNPEPILPNVQMLCDAVVAGNYDCGIAFDGDADRVGLVKETGRFVNQLQVYAMLYWHLLEDRSLRGDAVYTVSSSEMIPRIADAYGCEAHETMVGFKYVGPEMVRTGAIIGGEESGGFGFGSHLAERDGILAALMLLEMRAHRGQTFEEILADLQERFGPSEYARTDFRFVRTGYQAVAEGTLAQLPDVLEAIFSEFSVKSYCTLASGDGCKVRFVDGSWLLLRFSGTEPVMRLYSEAPSLTQVNGILSAARKLVPASSLL